MYRPIHIRGRKRRRSRRRVWVTVVMIVASLAAGVVTVLRTMPHHPPAEPLTLDEIALMMPGAAQTEIVATIVRGQIAAKARLRSAAAAAVPAVCIAMSPPHKWDKTQRENATTIVQVGMALDIPKRGLVVALAAAMQESKLYNLGHLGANNDHDSLGLFQQRPSMGWGSEAQVTDPVYSATAFFLALRRVPGWKSMKITFAAQRVQRSAFPEAYAKWEDDATALSQKILCQEEAGQPATSA
jgi:hypothetical protein